MSILKVARMGHPVLRNPALQKFIDDMIETMYEYHGVGLAAPQVHEGLRLFVAMLDEEPGEDAEAVVVVNPEIVPGGTAMEEGWEGCLSIPDIRGMVPRHTEITLKALDRNGKAMDLCLKGFPARVAQHEADHLDGVLFFDRMKSMHTLTFLEEFSRFWTKETD
jgi:peptide deformylase